MHRQWIAAALVVWMAGASAALAADDDQAIKQAYIAYLQARMDRDLEAARNTSTGDARGRAWLEADVVRQVAQERLQDLLQTKVIATSQPTSRPARPPAAQVWKNMLDSATVVFNGDVALLKPRAGGEFGFRKVDGAWKADLNRWQQGDLTERRIHETQAAVRAMNRIADDVEAGKITSMDQFRQAVMAAEAEVMGRPATRPATQPATQPGR